MLSSIVYGSRAKKNLENGVGFNRNDQPQLFVNEDAVGINTTSPQGALDVNGTLCITGTCISDWDALNQSLWTNSSGNIIITDTFVGINTTTPDVELEVNGSIEASENITLTSLDSYINFGGGGFMYDNGTTLIIGHN